MKLAKFVKFREEKFGGVLFETRDEKVYTLNPTGAAVVRDGFKEFSNELSSYVLFLVPQGRVPFAFEKLKHVVMEEFHAHRRRETIRNGETVSGFRRRAYHAWKVEGDRDSALNYLGQAIELAQPSSRTRQRLESMERAIESADKIPQPRKGAEKFGKRANNLELIFRSVSRQLTQDARFAEELAFDLEQ